MFAQHEVGGKEGYLHPSTDTDDEWLDDVCRHYYYRAGDWASRRAAIGRKRTAYLLCLCLLVQLNRGRSVRAPMATTLQCYDTGFVGIRYMSYMLSV